VIARTPSSRLPALLQGATPIAGRPAGVRFLVYTEFKDLKDHKDHVRAKSVDKHLFQRKIIALYPAKPGARAPFQAGMVCG
ncbi:MAG: hypothetical protein QMC09_02695, partial [Thauera sp.]